MAYAQAKGCEEAVLVYPRFLEKAVEVRVGTVRVRNVGLDLEADLERAGQELIDRLMR